jgi:hypothetical protein
MNAGNMPGILTSGLGKTFIRMNTVLPAAKTKRRNSRIRKK